MHVEMHAGGGTVAIEADAGSFDGPRESLLGLLQVGPDLYVAAGSFLSAEYHADHGAERDMGECGTDEAL